MFYFTAIFLLLCCSCNTKKYLKADEAFVKKNIIEFAGKDKVKHKATIKYDLSTVVKQKPNKRLFLVPRRYYYYKTYNRDSLKFFGRFVQRVFAEPPSIYSDDLAEKTASSMQYYMINRGYFNAEVYYETEIKKKKSYTTYTVYPNKLYVLDTINYFSEDSTIQQLLQRLKKDSHLESGGPADAKLYDLEVNRITQAIRNQGYAQFYPNYIDQPVGDSTNYKINLRIEALRVADTINHQIYSIGEIDIYPQFSPEQRLQEKADTIIDGVRFFTGGEKMKVKPGAILRAIKFRRGELYAQNKVDETTRQLNGIGIFRFISPKSEIDSLDNSKMNFKIYLSLRKHQEVGAEIELNNSRTSTAADTEGLFDLSLLGIGANLSYTNRNTLRAAELLSININGNTDLNFDRGESLFNTFDFTTTAKLNFPRFIDLTRMWKGLDKIRLISRPFYQALKSNSTTRLTLGYNYHDQINFSKYNSFNAYFGYDLQRNETDRYQINQIGIDYFIPGACRGPFCMILENNPFLAKSFQKQLFTGFLLRNMLYEHKGQPNTNGQSFYFRTDFEISGLEVMAVNWLYNRLEEPFKIGRADPIEYSQYVFLSLDGRYYKQLSPTRSIAYRLMSGIILPYGTSDEVPYVKQLYVGGPTSIRGWQIRELGPGAYREDVQDTIASYYQTGEFKLEFNVEYRFDMFWLLDGAFFVDGGNVWTLQEDTSRVGSQLLWKPRFSQELGRDVGDNFLKQLAISSGFGIRLDSYFFLRFDIGLQMRSPYEVDGSHWLMKSYGRAERGPLKKYLNYNLAIGYPF